VFHHPEEDKARKVRTACNGRSIGNVAQANDALGTGINHNMTGSCSCSSSGVGLRHPFVCGHRQKRRRGILLCVCAENNAKNIAMICELDQLDFMKQQARNEEKLLRAAVKWLASIEGPIFLQTCAAGFL
jgi:hypothetical protein